MSRSRAWRWWFGVLTVLLLTLVAPRRSWADPVIVAGREQEIVALVAPHFHGKELIPGWKLGDISIEPSSILLKVAGPGGRSAKSRLVHPSKAIPGTPSTASFAAEMDGGDDADASAALTALLAAVRANDRGAFWPAYSAPAPRVNHGVEQSPSWGKWTDFAGDRARDSFFLALAVLQDGVILFVAALGLVLVHLRRVLRVESRAIPLGIAALLVVGAVLRLTITLEAPMNAWSYDRVVPLARASFEGVILPWISRVTPTRFYLTDVIFTATLVLALVTPLVFFAHARYVLRDARGALFAMALLVLLPNHIRFSRADTEFVQSLATSSLTFVVLYTALRDSSRAWRSVCFVILPFLSVMTYFVRPENMFFYFVDLGAIALTTSEDAPRRRKVLAAIEMTGAFAFAIVHRLYEQQASTVREGLGLRTLQSAFKLLFDVRLNTLINPAITPPGLTLLAVLGAVTLVRSGHRGRAAFLVAWLFGFFIVHSFVVPGQEAMQARYHFHLITPLLLLAASSLPLVLKWPRRVQWGLAAYLALSPLAHWRFERDVDFNEMHEFAFLRAEGRKIPDGCTVLELSPAAHLEDPGRVLAPKLGRMAARLEGGFVKAAYKVVNSGTLRGEALGHFAHESPSEEALTLLRHPPTCLLVYEGLTCKTHRPPTVGMAPVCAALHAQASLQPIASTTFRSRFYDEMNAGRLLVPGDRSTFSPGLSPGEPVTLTMYRALAGAAAVH